MFRGMFTAALFRIVKNGNNPDAHQTVKGETVPVVTTEPSSTHRKEWTADTRDGLEGAQDCEAEWKKPDRKTPGRFHLCEILASAN